MKLSRISLVAILLLTACAGGEEAGQAPTPKLPCEPSGTSLRVAAENTMFDTDCLAVPAGRAFQITLDNRDQDQHNVAIYSDQDLSENLFRGDIFMGPAEVIYEVPALDSGEFFFQCDVHPEEMKGTFVVA